MELKSKDILVKIGEGSDLEVTLKRCSPLDFTMVQALPDVRHVLFRRWTIMKELPARPPTTGHMNKATMVKRELAGELWYDWVYANIPPYTIKHIMGKLEKLLP